MLGSALSPVLLHVSCHDTGYLRNLGRDYWLVRTKFTDQVKGVAVVVVVMPIIPMLMVPLLGLQAHNTPSSPSGILTVQK